MRVLDYEFADQTIQRLRALDATHVTPRERMSAAQMIGHLADSLRYSMGKLAPPPQKGNWLSQKIIAPLVFHGIMRYGALYSVRRNAHAGQPRADDLETLHALLEEYLNRVQTGDIEPAPHPLFGNIGIDGWGKVHVLHFEHHLGQFGV